jgi:pilus assembly protein CpaB
MKWAVIGLCLLGAVAASSAALLVNALRVQAAGLQAPDANTPAGASPEVNVLVSRRAMPAMTVLESGVVYVKSMPREQAPAHYISNPVDVVGKVLAKPIVEGQAFTTAYFSDSGASQQVAAVIPAGKRAVGIAVTNYAGLEGLLYPGCVVDVLVSLKPANGRDGAQREAFTTTLLENIQVLAIEQQTVVSPGKMVNQIDNAANSRANDNHSVTLLVDSRQAKALQLAMEQGTLSLALRNPLDSSSADHEAVWLGSLSGQDPRLPEAMPASEVQAPTTMPDFTLPSPKPHWDTMIIRAGAIETRSFPMPEAPR